MADSDDATTGATGATGPADTGAAGSTGSTGTTAATEAADTTDWKAMARKHEREAKAARERLQEIEDRDKSEVQKAADRASAAEKERDEARRDAMRLKVGVDKRLPAEIVELLKGDSEEEMAAHADRLATVVKQAVRPSGDVDQGRRGDPAKRGPAQEFADFIKAQSGA